MNRTRKIAGNLFWLFLGQAGSSLLAFISTIWLARKLTDEGFGLLAFVQAIVIYMALIVDLGLSTYGTREVSRHREIVGSIAANIAIIRFILACILYALLSIILLISHLPFETKLLFFGGGLWLFVQALNFEFTFQGLERMELFSLSRFSVQLVYLILVVLFITERNDLWRAPFYKAVGGGVSVICLSVFLFKRMNFRTEYRANIALWRSYLRESIVMALSVVAIKIYYNFDTIMLGLMDEPEVVGWYNAAYKIILLVIAGATLIQFAFAPTFSRDKEDSNFMKNVLRDFSLILTFTGSIIAGTLILSGPVLVNTLYGNVYENANNALMLLSISSLLIFCETIFIAPLLYVGFQRDYLWIVISGAVVNIILNLIAIPLFSYIGAAVTTIISHGVIILIGYIRFSHNCFIPREALRVTSSTLALLLLSFIFSFWLLGQSLQAALFFSLFFTVSFSLIHKDHVVRVWHSLFART